MKQTLTALITEPTGWTVLQVPRAFLASVAAAGLDFGTLLLLVESFGWNPVAAAVVAYLTGCLLQYALCLGWVFSASSRNASAAGFAFFVALSLGGLLITWVVMAVAFNALHLHYIPAKVLALGFAFSWNFTTRKYLIFQPNVTSRSSVDGIAGH